MRFLTKWWTTGERSQARPRRVGPRVEMLEARDMMSATPKPVLLVIANQDFYYKEYADTRRAVEAAGVGVVVGAGTTQTAVPHGNSGQAPGTTGAVTPDVALGTADASDYSAIVFVGGWGSSVYQYAYNDPNLDGVKDNYYANALYNGDDNVYDGVIAPTKAAVNDLINDFIDQDKYVAGLCHGVTALAWARVDGASLLAGKRVAVPLTVGSPAQFYAGEWHAFMDPWGQYEQVKDNGGLVAPVSGQYGDPTTVADDVVVDGRIITGENYDSARHFGGVIARAVLGDAAAAAPPAEQPAPRGADAPLVVVPQKPVPAHVDYFLKLDGVDGESTRAGRRDEIEVVSYSWGAAATGTHGAGGGGGAGKVQMQDFHFVMK